MIPPPPTSTLFPYTTLFRSSTVLHALPLDEGRTLPSSRELEPREDVKQADSNVWNVLTASSQEVGLNQQKRSEEHTSELQSHVNLVCRLLLEKKKEITCEQI